MKIAVFFALLLTVGGSFAFADQVTTEIPPNTKTHYVDEQIMIMADISNNQDVPQNFAYLTQVRNDQDVVISAYERFYHKIAGKGNSDSLVGNAI